TAFPAEVWEPLAALLRSGTVHSTPVRTPLHPFLPADAARAFARETFLVEGGGGRSGPSCTGQDASRGLSRPSRSRSRHTARAATLTAGSSWQWRSSGWGHAGEAGTAFDRFEGWFRQQHFGTWQKRMRWQLLHQEAKALLSAPPPMPRVAPGE